MKIKQCLLSLLVRSKALSPASSIWIEWEPGWCTGGITSLPPVCLPVGSQRRHHIGVEFIVGSFFCSKRFSQGTLVFPFHQKTTFPNFNLIWRKSYSFLCMFLQLNSIDFENNPELKKLQFLAPGPKMAGLAKGTLQPKKEFNIKPGKIWKKSLTTSISSVIVMKVFCKVLVFWSDILSHQTWIVRIGEVWPPVWVWLLLNFGEVSLMVHSALSNQEQGNHDR